MLTVDDLSPHLPNLRRHARMLSGSTRIGDVYVKLCLEFLISEPERLQSDEPRLLLFQALHQVRDAIARQIQVMARDQPTGMARDAEQILQGLSAPFERRVQLLSAIEDFSNEDIATILQSDSLTVETAQSVAISAGGHCAGKTVVIIEDEPLIAEQIAGIVGDMGILVVGVAARAEEAVSLVAEHKPSLILSDIHLKDGDSGIKATWRIMRNENVPAVFITGFPDLLLTGDQSEPEFVVAKPFDPDALRTTVALALEIHDDRDLAEHSHDYLLRHLDKLVNERSWKVSGGVVASDADGPRRQRM